MVKNKVCAATREKRSSGFPTMSDTYRPVQSLKRAKRLIISDCVHESLYYPCSENKGADRLYSKCTADPRLCQAKIRFSYDSAQLFKTLRKHAHVLACNICRDF